jgi:aspartate/methionine/tyrosine aminotransferase
MADPGYPCYRHFAALLNAVPVGMPVDGRQAFQPTLDDVRAHWTARTRGVILASPSNPAGSLIEPEGMAAITDWVRGRGGFVIVDEIYQGLVHGREASSVLARDPAVFVINSFSKYFCMTGWRLGWAVVPEGWGEAVEKLAQNIFICPSAPAQYAALAAFTPGTLAVLEERRAEFRRRRDWLLPRLRELGFGVPAAPDGAFYVYADCARFCADSAPFAARVLEEALVAITPGADFGSHGAGRHVRFAYTRALPELEEGVARLKSFLEKASPAR